jgi:hypothetical protein
VTPRVKFRIIRTGIIDKSEFAHCSVVRVYARHDTRCRSRRLRTQSELNRSCKFADLSNGADTTRGPQCLPPMPEGLASASPVQVIATTFWNRPARERGWVSNRHYVCWEKRSLQDSSLQPLVPWTIPQELFARDLSLYTFHGLHE